MGDTMFVHALDWDGSWVLSRWVGSPGTPDGTSHVPKRGVRRADALPIHQGSETSPTLALNFVILITYPRIEGSGS